MTLEIQFLAWETHKNVAELNKIMRCETQNYGNKNNAFIT
jgi:hypothetical protein